MVHCAWFRPIEISGSARQCRQRHLRLSRPQQAPPRPRHTSAWRPSRPFTSMVTPKTRPEKRKHAIVVLHLAGLVFFQCHLLARNRRPGACPLVREKETSQFRGGRSANDPNRPSATSDRAI